MHCCSQVSAIVEQIDVIFPLPLASAVVNNLMIDELNIQLIHRAENSHANAISRYR